MGVRDKCRRLLSTDEVDRAPGSQRGRPSPVATAALSTRFHNYGDVFPDGDRCPAGYLTLSGGVISARATRRALFRIARVALVTLMLARDTASMSSPTLNGCRMSFPLNCAANCGGSIEKSPYGSRCSTTSTPVRMPRVSMPTRILIGPSYPRSRGSISVVQNAKPVSVCRPEAESVTYAGKCGGVPSLGEKTVPGGNRCAS